MVIFRDKCFPVFPSQKTLAMNAGIRMTEEGVIRITNEMSCSDAVIGFVHALTTDRTARKIWMVESHDATAEYFHYAGFPRPK